jgi:hypothetical protein
MELTHTHRTHQVRSDYQLAALHVILTFNGEKPTPGTIEDFEARFRGIPQFEESLRAAAGWLEDFRPGFKARGHDCGGQLCDQDCKFDTAIVEPKPEELEGGSPT